MRIVIPDSFPTLNEYVNAERTNRYIGAKIKKEETERVRLHCLRAKKLDKPVFIYFFWHVKNARKDPDNIAFAKKFILDGLVQAGVIKDDTQKYIVGFQDEFFIDKNERVEIELEEMEPDS